MANLTNKRILLGISGGIAAYKSADLVRRLREREVEVRVVMTESATKFVGPMTFQALSGQRVYVRPFEEDSGGMEHIELARWADAILIAPASANTLAKLAGGFADNLLTTLCLAAEAPLAVAPAMNQQMWQHAAVQHNVQTLKSRGVQVFGPASGEQACGEVGEGRMLEPMHIIDSLQGLFHEPTLKGLHVTITAGPTREPLDPVRYISNRSSGKMGYALAETARQAGAQVTLVSGPVSLPTPSGVAVIEVERAEEMHAAVMDTLDDTDIFIAAAAVADYRPDSEAEEKIKKNDSQMQLQLQRNPDILSEVSSRSSRPFCVGFAAETENLEDNALAKLERKQLDMIAANWVGSSAEANNIGFDSDDNALHVYTQNSDTLLRKASKMRLAQQLIELIASHYQESRK